MNDVKVIKKDDKDKDVAKEVLARMKSDLADMRRRFNGFVKPIEEKIAGYERLLNT